MACAEGQVTYLSASLPPPIKWVNRTPASFLHSFDEYYRAPDVPGTVVNMLGVMEEQTKKRNKKPSWSIYSSIRKT